MDDLILPFDTGSPKNEQARTVQDTQKAAAWKKTSVANLTRYVPSGTYFVRVRIGGKLIVESLKTNVFTVAKLRLADFIKERRQFQSQKDERVSGKMTFGSALDAYRDQLKKNTKLKPNAKLYREKSIQALVRTWPSLPQLDAKKITQNDCISWAATFVQSRRNRSSSCLEIRI